MAFLKSIPDVVHVQYERKFDRKMFLLRYSNGQTLKVEFTAHPFHRCKEGLLVEGIDIDSLKDILVNKIMALTDRKDPKDYVDLFYGLKSRPTISLQDVLLAAETKFGIKGIEHVIGGRFLEVLPLQGTLMMREKLDYEAIAQFFKNQALSLISGDLK